MSDLIDHKRSFMQLGWLPLRERKPLDRNIIRTYLPAVDLTEEVPASVNGLSYRQRRVDLANALDEIAGFNKLNSDWAGEGTREILVETRSLAKTLLTSLPMRISIPKVSPTADGEILLVWAKHSNKLQVIIDPENVISWVRREGSVASSDAVEWRGEISSRLVTAIEAVFA